MIPVLIYICTSSLAKDKMKKVVLVITVLIIVFQFSCKRKTADIKTISIIPQPVSIEQCDGFFELNKKTKIVFPDEESARQVAGYLTEFIKLPTGFDLSAGTQDIQKNSIVLNIDNDEQSGDESYELQVNKRNILITAGNSKGLFYGIQSLLQLLPPEIFSRQKVENVRWVIPCCTIKDEPRFSWRGMHLDVSRHFFPVEFIKRYIDLIAMHKMNTFHWHLTDDNGWRIEIKKYPLLTEVSAWRVDREDMPWREVTPPEPGEKATYGGFYTREEIKEVVEYASERQITIIPEIEMPGHTSEVFAAYPELSCRGEKLYVRPGSYWPNTDIFCAGNEEVFTFLENVLDEVMELFPAKYIHIGGDEADKTEWEKCPKCQKRIREEGLKNENELQSYFIKRIEKYINSKGRRLIGWDEILEGGLAPEATVMSWRGFEGGIEAATQGHDVIMCPVSYCYFDYYQANPDFEPVAIGGFTTLKKVYSFEPVPEELDEVQAKHILGGQGNVWTEFIATPEHAEYMAVPRMTALAEVLWSPLELKDWESFRERLEEQEKRLFLMGINYSQGSWKVTIQPAMENGKYHIALETEQWNMPVHYTLDGSDPTEESPVYEKPFDIDKTTIIKAGIFVNGKLKEDYSEKEIVLHKGVGKNSYLKEPPDKKYPARGAMSLVDGLKGSDSYRDGYWLGFQGKDMKFEVDLGKEEVISSVNASFYQNTGAWIFMPENVTFEILDENKNKAAKIVLKPDATEEVKGVIIEEIKADFEKVSGRYIRVHAKNIKTIPAWHEGAGAKAWIFADEVVVE